MWYVSMQKQHTTPIRTPTGSKANMAANAAANPLPILVTTANVVAGNGLVAQQEFKKGERILEANALIICNTGESYKNWKAHQAEAWFETERQGTTNRLQRAVERLSQADRATFDNSYTPDATATEYEQLVDRCSRNSFEFYTKRVWKIQVVVYNVISRANHSCGPNVTLEIQTEGDNKGQARLIATKAIPNNSEILVNYISENWTDNSDARKALLDSG
jgi:hypothetical protein